MGGQAFSDLRSQVLALSEAERAELAQVLMRSLDAPADANAAELWDYEIQRRLAQIDEGTATLIDRAEFQRRLTARLDKP